MIVRHPSWTLIGGAAWFLMFAALAAWSAATGARPSTSVFLVVIGLGPAIVMSLMGGGPPRRSVAELLHSDADDDR
jgi:hypothetical protein